MSSGIISNVTSDLICSKRNWVLAGNFILMRIMWVIIWRMFVALQTWDMTAFIKYASRALIMKAFDRLATATFCCSVWSTISFSWEVWIGILIVVSISLSEGSSMIWLLSPRMTNAFLNPCLFIEILN